MSCKAIRETLGSLAVAAARSNKPGDQPFGQGMWGKSVLERGHLLRSDCYSRGWNGRVAYFACAQHLCRAVESRAVL